MLFHIWMCLRWLRKLRTFTCNVMVRLGPARIVVRVKTTRRK